jgi:ribosomal protein S18 acetylase RimI-like enzyme
LGVATHLLSTLIERARVREPKLGFVWAHVWEASEEALEWYVKRGFEVLPDVVKWYYRRLRPAGARVVIMELEEGRGEGG